MAERSYSTNCGKLGIKRGLTQRVFYELVRPPMTASPSAPLSPAQSLLPKISSQSTDGAGRFLNLVSRRHYRNVSDTKSASAAGHGRLSFNSVCELGFRGSLDEWGQSEGLNDFVRFNHSVRELS